MKHVAKVLQRASWLNTAILLLRETPLTSGVEKRSLILSPYAPVDRETFEIKADTAFHKGDRLLMSFDSQFIIQDGMRDAIIMMVVTYTMTVSSHNTNKHHF